MLPSRFSSMSQFFWQPPSQFPLAPLPTVPLQKRSCHPSLTPMSTAWLTTTARPTSRSLRPRMPTVLSLDPSRSPCRTGGSRQPPTRRTMSMGSWPRWPTPGSQSTPQSPLEVTAILPHLPISRQESEKQCYFMPQANIWVFIFFLFNGLNFHIY